MVGFVAGVCEVVVEGARKGREDNRGGETQNQDL